MEKEGFKKFAVKNSNGLFIIFLPDNYAVEDLFLEFDNHLKECISKLWNTSIWKRLPSIPRDLDRTHMSIRSKTVSSKEEAIRLIKNTDDVKDLFWKKVEKYGYEFKNEYSKALKSLLS